MIGFNFLGKMGQLGNQMFQLASLKGIAKNNRHNFCIPNHDEVLIDNLGNRLRIELFDSFLLKKVSLLNLQKIDESHTTYLFHHLDVTIPHTHSTPAAGLIPVEYLPNGAFPEEPPP